MDGFAIRPGQVVGQHPSPPDVLGPQPVAPVELHDDHRAAHLFARMQPEMRQLLAALHAHSGAVVMVELRRPLARPAQDHDGPFPGQPRL